MRRREVSMKELYHDFKIKPYVSPERDLTTEIFKPVPRINMEPLEDGLLAGDIILLWRIHFGTFTNETWYCKYFEYTYGINGEEHFHELIKNGYAIIASVFDSLKQINATQKKAILKTKSVTGLSKLKSAELDEALKVHFTEEELARQFSVREVQLTEKGKKALENNQAVIDRHPKKGGR